MKPTHPEMLQMARKAIQQVDFLPQGIQVSIPDDAKTFAQGCGCYVDAIIYPVHHRKLPKTKLIKYVTHALWQTPFPHDSEGYKEVGVDIDKGRLQGPKPDPEWSIENCAKRQCVPAQVWVQYSFTAVRPRFK